MSVLWRTCPQVELEQSNQKWPDPGMFGSARTQPGQDLLLNAPAFCVNKLHIFCHLPSATAAVDDAVGLPLTYRSRLTDADSHCFHSLEGGRGGEGTWQSSFGEVVCMLSGPGE